MAVRRILNVLLGLAAAALISAAVVDAVHKKHSSRTTLPPRATGRLGTLYYVDRHCHLHGLTVPESRPVAAPVDSGCTALMSPATPAPGWSVWPSTAHLAAWCDGRRVLVAAARGPALPMIGGCAPAWRPDGSLTYIRRGTIVEFPRTGRAQDVLTAAQLAAALGRGWQVDALAWLTPNRLVVAASNGANGVLAVLADKRLLARVRVRPGDALRASPKGTFIVARGAEGIRVYDARLRRLKGFDGDTAVTWSPDEHWRAEATAARIVLSTRLERVVLRFGARDLAWTR